ncbi:MAG: glucose-6-phosphate isomerase [Oscillospiraceae bacterium]|nr:glucose-6-phosphate isomerase [Oscillospiraceae bacterium]
MINVDLSNVWGEISLMNLLNMEKEVFDAHMTLSEGTGAGSDYLGWQKLPRREPSGEIFRIHVAAEKIRAESDVCVVVGIGGSCLGAKAAIELLQGPNRNIGRGKGDPQVFFAGNSLSTRHWNELMSLLEGKDFSVIVISKSGATLEPAIAFRNLRWMLERKYGTDAAGSRIYAVTDPVSGALRKMAEEYGWERFSIPVSVGGRYSVLSAVGLLPMAAAGIDIMEMLRGAMDAKESYDIRSFENPVWQYAALRNLLYRHGKAAELFVSFEPGFRSFGLWWQQLFGQSEGKNGKGLLPVPVEFTADLHSLGQLIQEGQRNIFETMIRFEPTEKEMTVINDVRNMDSLNYLKGRTLSYVEEQAYLGTAEAHADGGIPVLTMECSEICERTIGELFYFMELSCAVSAYILGVNPFNQPGVELYKENMLRLLGRPGSSNH